MLTSQLAILSCSSHILIDCGFLSWCLVSFLPNLPHSFTPSDSQSPRRVVLSVALTSRFSESYLSKLNGLLYKHITSRSVVLRLFSWSRVPMVLHPRVVFLFILYGDDILLQTILSVCVHIMPTFHFSQRVLANSIYSSSSAVPSVWLVSRALRSW